MCAAKSSSLAPEGGTMSQLPHSGPVIFPVVNQGFFFFPLDLQECGRLNFKKYFTLFIQLEPIF